MDSELNQQVVLLMGGAVVKVRRTAHGATVLVTDEDSGEMVMADTAVCQHLRELLEEQYARAYAAERRVRELDARICAMEQAFDYGQPNPFRAKD
jgi:hypothetical protein